jgi:hypothetical protein
VRRRSTQQVRARVEGDPTARRRQHSRRWKPLARADRWPGTSPADPQPARRPAFCRALSFAPATQGTLQSGRDRTTPTNARAVRPRRAVDSRGRPLAVLCPEARHECARCRPTRPTTLHLRQTQQRPLTAQQRSPARAWRPRRSQRESSSRPRWPAPRPGARPGPQVARQWRRGSRARPPRPPAAPRAELPAPHAEARARAGRRNPARRSSDARRSRRRARRGRRCRSGPPSRPPILPRPKRRGSRRSSPGAEASPCSPTASEWTRSCHRSAPCPRKSPCRPPAREPVRRRQRRGRRRDADRRRMDGRDRTRTGAGRAHSPARSTPAQPTPAALVQTRSGRRLAAQAPSLLPGLRTQRT